jgi:hypothetical protein
VADLRADRGDTNVYDMAAKKFDATVLPLTGASIWFTVKADASDADPGIVQKTVGAGITVTDALLGTFQVVLSPGDTSAVTPGRYHWDCQVKEASGRVTTVGKGAFFIDPDYTRST